MKMFIFHFLTEELEVLFSHISSFFEEFDGLDKGDKL